MCSVILFFKFGNIWKKQKAEVFYEKSVLKNLANVTGKQVRWSVFLIEFQTTVFSQLWKKTVSKNKVIVGNIKKV